MTDASARLSAALTGRYRIERELGAGGMATVYLAEDLKHDRKVAIKVLKPELAAVLGAERFVVEIKTTAALSHPHILPLFDSGTADGFLFYVMPYIQGETIREKLNRETQFGVDEAVRIAREVADALDYAHRHGVIHRDIKPENILLHDGRAMVMDFGIALAVSAAAGGRMTETGLSLGTPHYMSPEQATAEKEISPRSDQYSLGSVLYEMLTGNPPHTGASAQQIIMKIITEPAESVTKYRKSVPANVAAAVAKSIETLPADRFESAKAFADALANPAYRNGEGIGASVGDAPPPVGAMRFVPWIVAAGALVVAAIFAMRGRSANDARVTAAVIPLEIRTPTDLPLNEVGQPISIAPDGSFIVFVGADPEVPGKTALWFRSLDRLDATPIAGTRGGQRPQVMPDGKSVLFLKRAADGNDNDRWEVGIGGGVPSKAPLASGILRLRDGRVLVASADSGSFAVVSAAAAATIPQRLFTTNQLRVPRVVTHDGRWMATVRRVAGVDSVILRTLALRSGHVVAAGTSPTFIDDDLLAFRAPDGTLQIGRLRPDKSGFAAQPVSMVPSVSLAGDVTAVYAVGDDGTLVYTAGASAAQSRLVFVSGGRDSPIPNSESRVYGGIRVSPDGRRAALSVGALTSSGDISIIDLSLGSLNPLTTDGVSTRAAWTPDGKKVTYLHALVGLTTITDTATPPLVYQRAPDASGPADTMRAPWRGRAVDEFDWSPDGRYAALRMRTGDRLLGRDVVVWRVGTDTLIPIAAEAAQERGPRISPDGKWLIYVSDRSGRDEVYAESFPHGGNRAQLSADGGREGVWSRDGSQVFFRGLDGWMMSAHVSRGAQLQVTSRAKLFDASPYLANQFLQMYDVLPDGRFLMFKLESQAPRTDVVIIRNWVQQVRARLKGGGQ